jgi:hypothetical protein
MSGVVDKVKGVCLRIDDEDRKGLHRRVIGKLKRVFVQGGYRVYLEYPICFESRIRKSGDKIWREGNVDLVAVKNGRKVAIEFDAGVHLKFKSIEKLFQVGAGVCIGIVRGKSSGLEGNIGRIEEIRKELRFPEKKIWLIVLSGGRCHRV